MEGSARFFAAGFLGCSLIGGSPLLAQDGAHWYGGFESGFWTVTESIGFRGVLPKGFGLSAGLESLSASRQFGGYRFSDLLAVESAQTQFGSKGLDCDAAGSGGPGCLGSAWRVSGLATVPFASGISLYGRVGLHRWQSNAAEDPPNRSLADLARTHGMGLRYGLSRSVTLHAESEYFSDIDSVGGIGLRLNPGPIDTSVHSIGLTVRF
jgi:OmpA-like transmembrane domain